MKILIIADENGNVPFRNALFGWWAAQLGNEVVAVPLLERLPGEDEATLISADCDADYFHRRVLAAIESGANISIESGVPEETLRSIADILAKPISKSWPPEHHHSQIPRNRAERRKRRFGR